jgi:hypothetical protein
MEYFQPPLTMDITTSELKGARLSLLVLVTQKLPRDSEKRPYLTGDIVHSLPTPLSLSSLSLSSMEIVLAPQYFILFFLLTHWHCAGEILREGVLAACVRESGEES